MPYLIPGGASLDDIFEPLRPGMTPRADTLYREPGGVDLAQRYAPLMYGARIGGYTQIRVPGGVDLADLFAAKGTAMIAPSFDKQTYSSTSQGGSGETGQISAATQFRLDGSGNFLATGNDNYTGGYTFQQGRVWAYGEPSEWVYRLYATSGAPYDTGWVSGSQSAFVEVSASRPASLPGQVEFSRDMVFETRRASGGNIITAKFWIHAGVYSWI